MNVLSLFDGSLGTLTIFWLVLIVVVFIYALYRFLSKCGRIIRDCNSISYPTTEDTLNKTLVGRVILQNVKQGTTDYAEDSLSVSTVAAPYKLNLRLAQSTPSILISLGILGTFLGLSVAILQFDHSSSDTIRTSINSLLSGMGTAFFTSVFGMLFSVVFLLLERTRYNDLCNAVDSLCERTDQAYRQSSEQFFDKRLEKISGQISGLQLSFGDNLDKVFDEKVTPVMTDISKKLENPAQAVVDGLIEEFRNLTSGLSDALTEKVNNKMNDLLEQFILATDAMKEVPGSIDTATTNLLKASGESIESQKAFTDETKKRFEKLAGDLSDSVKNQMSAIKTQFDNVAEAFKGIPQEIAGSVEAQKGVTSEFAEQIVALKSIQDIYNTAIERISGANKDLADAKSNIATLTSKITTAAESIQSASTGMVKSNEKMLSDFEEIYKLNRDVTGQVKDYSERIKGIEGGLKGIFSEIEKGLSNYATTSSKNMQGLLDVFTNSVTDACQNISNATTPLHETIGGILKALDKTEKSAQALLKRVESLPQQKN